MLNVTFSHVLFSRMQHVLSHIKIILSHKNNNHDHTVGADNMPTANRPSGSWSVAQENELQKLIRLNVVDYKNRNPEYLFQITEEHFPDYISPGSKGRNSAIQRMRNKFIQYEQALALRGARRK